MDVSKSLGAFDPGLFDGLDGALIDMLLYRLVVQLVPQKLMLVIGGYFIPHLALLLIVLRFWLCNVNIMLILLGLIVAYTAYCFIHLASWLIGVYEVLRGLLRAVIKIARQYL